MAVRLALLLVLALLGYASFQTTPLEVSLAQLVTPTPTRTATATPSVTPTRTQTATPSPTPARTSTATPSPTVTSTTIVSAPIASPTASPTSTPTLKALSLTPITRVPTRTSTATPTQIATATRTATATVTTLPTQTSTPTNTVVPAKPAFLAVAVTSLTRSSATITWLTDQPSTSQVEYGTVVVDSGRSVIDPTLVTSHRVVLNRLQPGATYRFRARGATAAGANGISAEATFLTNPADSGPELGDVAATRVTSTTATIGWLTGTGTVAQVEYGTSVSYTASTLLKVFRLPSQEITLTGLLPRSVYHFRVKSWDGLGALGASNDMTFTTAPAGPATLFGEPIVYPRQASVPGGQAAAYQYVAKESGQANLLRVFLDGGGASVVRVGLYSDLNGAPGSILTQGSTPGLSAGWATVSVPPVALVQGESYWIVVLSPLGNASVRELGIGGLSLTSRQTALAALPSTWASSTGVGTSGPMAVSVQQLPPAVTLMGPAEGAILSGKTILSAVVDDDQPVARVQFLVDGVPLGAPVVSPPYTVEWDTSTVSSTQPHFVSARANDLVGRTGTSAIVTVQVDNGPIIRNVVVTRGATSSSIRIGWNTDVLSDAQVEFGASAAYGALTPLNQRADVNHTADLTGLVPGSVYHFRVRSRDANGILGVSVDGLFITSEAGAN